MVFSDCGKEGLDIEIRAFLSGGPDGRRQDYDPKRPQLRMARYPVDWVRAAGVVLLCIGVYLIKK